MDDQTKNDYIEDLLQERAELYERLRTAEVSDDCPPHGIPRPDLSLVKMADDIPLVFWNLAIFRQYPGFIRVTTFMSADKNKTDHIVETGPTLAGPWRELKRQA